MARCWPDAHENEMNKLILTAVGFGLWLIPSASAQVTLGSTNIADRVSQIILPDGVLLNSTSPATIGLRPPRPERPDLPPEIKSKVLRFEKLREAYLDRQQDLLRKLRGATTDADRNKYRAQLQTLRDEWLEKARSFREEARARIRDFQSDLPKYREAWDSPEGPLDGANTTRKRRGQ